MNENFGTVLISKEQLQGKIREIGEKISRDYEGEELVLIGVLKGGFVFLADLMREISNPLELDFISVSSYGASTKTSGVVRMIKDVDIDVKDKNILIVEDIVDTGLTLKYIKELFEARGPKSVRVCTALDKPSRRRVELVPEYCGFEIPDEFVVGYGLDYNNKYRNIPDVYVLHPSVYSNKE